MQHRLDDEANGTLISVETRLEVAPAPEPEQPGTPPRRWPWHPPHRYVFWPGLVTMLFVAAGIGVGNWLLFEYGINPRNRGTDANADAVGMYVQALMLIWSIVSGWLLYRVDEESNKVAEAVAEGDLEAFHRVAPKRIAVTIRLLHVALSLLFIHSFHLYHFNDPLATVEVQVGIGFLVTLTIFFIWDLDDPFHGVITIDEIPPEWRKEVLG